MKDTYIKAISYYLPEGILTNEQLVQEFPEWNIDKISSKIGVKQRHIASENETASDLAFHASKKLFSEYSIQPNDIDFIILCTQSPDYFLPTTACILQDRLGISTSAGAFDFNLGCSGYIYGLAMAKGLIATNSAHNVLLLTAETYSKYLHKSDKSNRSIFGDGATATLLSTDGFAKIENFSFGTNGKGATNLIVERGASRNKANSNLFKVDEAGTIKSPDYLYMNGSEVFNFTLEAVPILIENISNANSIKKSDIDFLIEFSKIDADKFFSLLFE